MKQNLVLLTEKKPAIPVRDAFLDYLGIFLAIYLYQLVHETWVLVGSMVLVGIFQYRLQIIGHDGLHFSLHRNHAINDFFLRYFITGPQLTPMSLNRFNHLNHHNRFATPLDADWQYFKSGDKDTPAKFVRWVAWLLLFGSVFSIAKKLILGGADRSGTKPAKSKYKTKELRKDMLSIALSQVILLATFSATIGTAYYVVFWLIPLFGIFVPLNTLRSFCEHSVPVPDTSTVNRLYTFTGNVIENFVLAPHNMNIHYEHHRYMTVPYYNLPSLREVLRAEPDYSEHLRGSYLSHLFHFVAALPIKKVT